MCPDFARPLNYNELANHFLSTVLGYPQNVETGDIAIHISDAEKVLAESKESTLESTKNRHTSYKGDDARTLLREKIFRELIAFERLGNDDEIAPGRGGAKPVGIEPKSEGKAFFLIGLPASGKSSIANQIADHYGAYILDSDYAKRKFPEYQSRIRNLQHVAGASVVHDESSLVIFGDSDPKYDSEPSLIQFCVSRNYNIIIPKIGHSPETIHEIATPLQDQGYELHLVLISLDRVKSTKRALKRFLETNRYVPLSLVFDGYANDPILTYYRELQSAIWQSTGKISTDVEMGDAPRFIHGTDGNPAVLFRN